MHLLPVRRFTPLQVCVSWQHLQYCLWPLILLQTPIFFICLVRSAGGTGKKAKLFKKRGKIFSQTWKICYYLLTVMSFPQNTNKKVFKESSHRFLEKAKQQFNVTTGCQAPKRAKKQQQQHLVCDQWCMKLLTSNKLLTPYCRIWFESLNIISE